MSKCQVGVYEAGALKVLLERGPLNLYHDRPGDGRYEAVQNLLEHQWISEDATGAHHLLKREDAVLEVDAWFAD